MSYEKPKSNRINFNFSQSKSYSPPASDSIDFDFLPISSNENKIEPFGIFNGGGVGKPQLLWTEFVRPSGIFASNVLNPVLLHAKYIGIFNFLQSQTYSPPASDSIPFIFGQGGAEGLILTPGIESGNFGQLHISTQQFVISAGNISSPKFESNIIISNWKRLINPEGLLATSYSVPKIINKTQEIKALGFVSLSFGNSNLWNFNKEVKTIGFNSSIVNDSLKIYNSRQYLNLNNRGINTALHGSAYVQGGVKYVSHIGFNTSILSNPKLINTKADQFADLAGQGIKPHQLPNPSVSPRIIYAKSHVATFWGNALVQFPPHPKGFFATSYGVAWVSHSPRYLEPSYIDAFNSGYPKVFDPTQKIGVTGVNTIIPGGVFGDISIRNVRRVIKISSFYSQSFSDWGSIESNLRKIIHKGLDSQSFGSNSIRNKTPSIAPIGIYALSGLDSSVGYRIRTVKPSGLYQPKLGNPTLTKTPELKLSGINQNVFGSTWVSHKTRSVYAGLGRESMLFGSVTVWHYSRKLNPEGIKNDTYGSLRIEHGRRLLLVQGSNQALFGNNIWVSFARRHVEPISIVYPNIPIHRVGGTQSINPLGYIATLFGTRIVPENQSIYPQGFINFFGLTVVDLWRKYIKPNGFLTTGQEAGHRFGTAKFWNLRQFIEIYYDVDSGLVPPLWTGWTSINNRNKSIGAIGSNFSHIAEPTIENKARPILPFGFDSVVIFNRTMITDRVRNLKLQGIDTPYISSWSVIFNSAAVLASKGFNSQSFGIASIANTRRYFNRIGNFESLLIGFPMVSYRIRRLTFEQRYAISPPYIPIHRIDLHTRYIDEVGRFDDHQVFGNPSLSIHWNIITPRWTLRDAYGTPVVKNITPELGTRGRNSEEFGQTNIRTQWRELLHLGSETVAWGRSEIAFRDRQFSVSGFTQWAIPRHTVTKTGVPPYYPQYIWLDSVEIDGKQNNGHGIEILERQVSFPSVKSNVISSEGFVASRYGNHYTQSNGILVQPGLQELTVGSHFITLKNKKIVVPTMGDFLQIKDAKPRISPWTIWVTEDTPSQAITNHPESNRFYPINSSGGTRPAGEVFGNLNISLQHRKLSIGVGNQSGFGNGHRIELRKRYISLKDFGFRSQRIGFHVVGPFDQNIIQFDSNNMQGFGRPSLKIPDSSVLFIKPDGLNPPSLNRPILDFFNHTIKAIGSNHLQMGIRKSDDTPFMWQGLRVGELIKGNYGGFENQVFGNNFISLKVRNIEAQGFESFVMEYDYTQFDKRMRIIRQELTKPKLFIKPVGVDALFMALPNIKPAVHYIRPDGNADQYRKGAF